MPFLSQQEKYMLASGGNPALGSKTIQF